MIRNFYQTINRRIAVSSRVLVGERFHVGPRSRIWAPTRLQIQDDVYVGKNCTIEVDGVIGPGTLIANNVGIVGRRDHDMREVGALVRRSAWVGDEGSQRLRTSVEIEGDVWIGFGAIVLAPVTIHRGAIIAAGAVVTDTVGPYEIVAGNPARPIGMRFTPADISVHESLLGLPTCLGPNE